MGSKFGASVLESQLGVILIGKIMRKNIYLSVFEASKCKFCSNVSVSTATLELIGSSGEVNGLIVINSDDEQIYTFTDWRCLSTSTFTLTLHLPKPRNRV